MKKMNLKECCTSHEKSNVIGFALAGLAIGVTAWYLFGTKQGRENLNMAVEGINEVSSKLKDKVKSGKERAESAVESVKEAGKQAYEKGAEVVSEVEDAAKDTLSKQKDKLDEIKSEVKK